jgi:4-carboxymuconolactone decarboxylase
MKDRRIPVGLVEGSENPVVTALFDRLAAGTVGLVNVHRVLANAPEPFAAFINFAHALRFKTSLDPAEREIAILRALHRHCGAYEIAHHRRLGTAAGLTDRELDLACSSADPASLGARRATLAAFADAFASGDGIAPDLAAATKSVLDDQALVELSLTLALYVGLAHLTSALDVPMD